MRLEVVVRARMPGLHHAHVRSAGDVAPHVVTAACELQRVDAGARRFDLPAAVGAQHRPAILAASGLLEVLVVLDLGHLVFLRWWVEDRSHADSPRLRIALMIIASARLSSTLSM